MPGALCPTIPTPGPITRRTNGVSVEVERVLKDSGALLEGHFLLTSGLHSSQYLEKFHILQYPWYTERLCGLIAQRFRGQGIQTVAGPTVGGVILAYEVGKQLGVRGIFAEREDHGRAFQRGFALAPGERVLVVDDVLTTGGSVIQMLDAVRRRGAVVAGVGILVDRAGEKVDLGVPFFACVRLDLPAYSPDQCPLCAQGVPLKSLGGKHSTPS
ncbi:MAG: orotate phosphoribosyltransferase [Chloroflexi bacterium]|nr:orotate phosphoribosyltransferase [Chloroflexota bacterium]